MTRYIVRWSDGTEDTYTSPGDVTHVYRNIVGYQTIRVLLVDEDGTHPLAGEHTVLVTGAVVVERTLFIIGGNDDDHVTIHEVGKTQLRVHANFFPGKRGREFRDFQLADFDRVVVYVNGGDDQVTVAGNVDKPFIIDGGEGNDHLNSGNGPSIVLGSAGNDNLIGGGGRNILVGGVGADRMNGHGDDDILIGGRTVYDSDLLQWRNLDALLAAWNSSDSFETRVNTLRDGVDPAQTIKLNSGETVFNDDDADVLIGSAGFDWFFADLLQDDIRDKKKLEFWDLL